MTLQEIEKPKSFAKRNPILMQYIKGTVTGGIVFGAFWGIVAFTLNSDETKAINKHKESYAKMLSEKSAIDKKINDSVSVWKQNEK